MNKPTISEVKQANPIYFEKGKKKLHGDVSYRVLKANNGLFYFVREGLNLNGKRKFDVFPLSSNGTMGKKLDFTSQYLEDVKDFVKYK